MYLGLHTTTEVQNLKEIKVVIRTLPDLQYTSGLSYVTNVAPSEVPFPDLTKPVL